MAEDWGIPPWQVEDAPKHWWEKWRARKFAVNRRQEVEAAKWQTRK